jgi:hypothetical protein
LETAPDYVGLSEAAELAGVSRQNLRQRTVAYANRFPPSVHQELPPFGT